MDRRVPLPAVALMAAGALTLFAASTVHFGAEIPIALTTIYDPFPGAAIPEAVLGVVLALGAFVALARVRNARAIAIGIVALANLVVIYGMSITVRGGRTGDVVYHSILLLGLLMSGILLVAQRGRSVRRAEPEASTPRHTGST